MNSTQSAQEQKGDGLVKIKTALVSVSDKSGIVDFCASLSSMNIKIISTGGTAEELSDAGIPVTEVADYTGFPEMMGGRLKTLHPKVHGGILARRGIDDAVMAANGIKQIDLVVVNLYPFGATIAERGCTFAQAKEKIDIGGPTMIRSAAKNENDVGVIVDPKDYHTILDELKNFDGSLTAETRLALMLKAFRHTADYDNCIADYLAGTIGEPRM